MLGRHRERVEVYLQYDGESAEASTHHRGADIRRFKERAIERLSGAGIFTTLTMTAALGVNDDEIGFVIKRALDTPYVGGVTIQPVFGSGRSAGLDPMDRLTHTGVLARLEEQTAGQVTWRDLTALPCSHPHCCSVGYLLRDDSGTWSSLVSLIGHERLKQWLDLEPDVLANRIADDAIPDQLRAVVKGSLLDLLSEQSSLSHPSMATIWRDICTSCDLGIGTLATLAASKLPGQRERLRQLLGERVLRVTVKPFMDMNTMIEERLTQCCVHVATVNAPDVRDVAHQCAPFCAVQAWAPLSRSRISTAVGSAARCPWSARDRPASGDRHRTWRPRTARAGGAAVRPAEAVRLRDGRPARLAPRALGAARVLGAGRRSATRGRAARVCCDPGASSGTPGWCCSTSSSWPLPPPTASTSHSAEPSTERKPDVAAATTPPYGGPPSPPYGGPPGPYPPGQSGAAGGMSNKAKFWLGVVLTLPAMFVGGVITVSRSAAVDGVNGEPRDRRRRSRASSGWRCSPAG